jgi:Uma2 family endonuclease
MEPRCLWPERVTDSAIRVLMLRGSAGTGSQPFPRKELEKFGQLCAGFAAEVMSSSNALAELTEKMAEYIANGAQLGWLIDPYEARVYIYRCLCY